MSKELVRLLREIEEMSGKLYSNTSQDKDLRVCKGAKRLAELVEEGISAETERKTGEYLRLSLVDICFFLV